MAHLDDVETRRANARYIRRAMQASLLSRERERELALRFVLEPLERSFVKDRPVGRDARLARLR